MNKLKNTVVKYLKEHPLASTLIIALTILSLGTFQFHWYFFFRCLGLALYLTITALIVGVSSGALD